MSFSMNLGYKATFKYILGVFTGVFLMMLLCAWLTFGLSSLLPEVTVYLKYIGAAYIFYLAFKTLKVNYDSEAGKKINPKYLDGVLLQLVNPKTIFYGMTVYSTFFRSIIEHWYWLILSALVLSCITFIAVSTWALFGSGIRHFMKNKTVKTVFSVLMALGLVYAAIVILLG